jgi:hypothetical protein
VKAAWEGGVVVEWSDDLGGDEWAWPGGGASTDMESRDGSVCGGEVESGRGGGHGLGAMVRALMLFRGTNVSLGTLPPPPWDLPESSRPWKRRVLPRRWEGEERDNMGNLVVGRTLSL